MERILKDTDASWQKNGYAVLLGESFKTYKDVLTYAMQPMVDEATDEKLKGTLNEMIASLDLVPELYTKPNASDSSVGGNDAFNPYWQFGIDDDIIHPLTSTDGKGERGMGRVYSEIYNDTQQVLWLNMGVPEFVNFTEFWSDCIDDKLANLMNTGECSLGDRFQSMALEGGKLLMKMPFLPLIWMDDIIKATTETPITKYFNHKPAMTSYYRLVNTMMAQLAVGMNIIENGLRTGGVKNAPKLPGQYEGAGIPEMMRSGPDIYAIMYKRALRNNPNMKPRSTDQLMEQLRTDGKELSIWGRVQKMMSQFGQSAIDSSLLGYDYIGFRVERSTDSSESINNSSGPSELSQKMNAKRAEKMERNFSGRGSSTGDDLMKAITGDVSGVVEDLLSIAGEHGSVEVVTGNGFYDMPDSWTGSSFSRNYSFNIQLRSRYGDPVSIFQSVYIPLILLLAAALPRSVGKNSYCSPFLIRGYCKGMFSIPLGLIESMTIRRGLPEFGWSNSLLPTAIDISLSIKDLSPAFFLSMADSGFSRKDILSRNDQMAEYITTLSGIGLADRTCAFRMLKERARIWAQVRKTTWLNPLYWGSNLGRSNIGRLLTSVLPFDKMGN